MNSVLILYPEAFLSFSKFERKVTRILENLDSFKLISSNDHNNHIQNLCDNKFSNTKLEISEEIDFGQITHAIIFDDGEEFSDQLKKLNL